MGNYKVGSSVFTNVNLNTAIVFEIGTNIFLRTTYLIEFITVLFVGVNLNSIWFRAVLSLGKASKSQKG